MSRFNPAFLAAVFLAAVPVGALAYSPVVINEVDYDQPGSVDGGEFIELKNVSQKTVNLSGYSIVLVDGANLPGSDFMTLNMPDVDVAPGEYFVICAAADISTLASGECDRNAPYNTVKIPNDRRDGIRLLNGTEVLDMLTYGEYLEGCTEGDTPAPEDNDTNDDYSIARVPDGLDTDVNGFDFKGTCSSPGRANYTAEECLCIRTVCIDGKVCNPATGVCEVVQIPEDVIEDTSSDQDASEPSDTTAPDSSGQDGTTVDSSGIDSLADTNASTDSGPAGDTAGGDQGYGFDINQWIDLPVVGDQGQNGQDGESGDGCSAGRHPAAAEAGLQVLA